ncbi:hypothetical protein MJO29_002290, partial [Puccinia striiformis f. sp. tritici]
PMLPYLPVEFDWENFLATTLLDALGNTIMCALAGLVIAVTLISEFFFFLVCFTPLHPKNFSNFQTVHKLLTPQQDKFTKQQLTAISKG